MLCIILKVVIIEYTNAMYYVESGPNIIHDVVYYFESGPNIIHDVMY